MTDRRRFDHTQPHVIRSEEAAHLREQAALLPAGAVRDELLRRARLAEARSSQSPELRQPLKLRQ